jgi:hypothetical protein
MDLAAGTLRAGSSGRRVGTAPDRDRGRCHRAEDAGREDRRGRPAAARCHRNDPGSLRGLGRAESTGALQLEFPGTSQPAARGARSRRVLRVRDRGRAQADAALAGRQRGPNPRRSHLRGPPRRRPLASHQRAAHQRRRLCLGGNRHHHHQAARRKVDGQREALDGDGLRSAALAAGARAANPGAGRSGREIRGREDPRRGGEPNPSSWPI